jgi:hypothetical protein
MKKVIFTVLFLATILAGCAVERDLTKFIGTWKTATYTMKFVNTTNGVVMTNYTYQVDMTNYITNFIYTFDANTSAVKITLTNQATNRIESVTWILDEIGKTFTVYFGSTNERFEYTMTSNALRIKGIQLVYDSTNIDIFERYHYSFGTVDDLDEYSLQYIDCVDPTTIIITGTNTN